MPRRKRITPEVRRARVYRERDRVVRSMGFDSYPAYLRSELWRNIRAQVLERSLECYGCGMKATQAHHTAYRKKDLEGRDLGRILAVCASCHRKAEFRSVDSTKLNTAQATAKLRQMRTLGVRGDLRCREPLSRSEITDAEEVALDCGKLGWKNGEYLGNDELAVGDMVRLKSGAIGRVERVRQANYLPRFLVNGRWIGKTRIKSKLLIVAPSHQARSDRAGIGTR